MCVTAPYVVDPVKVIDCPRIDTDPVKDERPPDVKPFECTDAAENVCACV